MAVLFQRLTETDLDGPADEYLTSFYQIAESRLVLVTS
jgi:hypothetical protein